MNLNEYNFNPILKKIADEYGIKVSSEDNISPIGNGHINKTFKLTADDGREYLVQKINTYVFNMPVELMINVENVTRFLTEKIEKNGGDPERETLHVVKTMTGNNFIVDDDGEYWRIYKYLENAVSYDLISPELFEKAGESFGDFQNKLADFPIDTLYETIPKFHDTYDRLCQLKTAVENNDAGRLENVKEQVKFAFERENDTKKIVNLISQGKIPVRVTHNDTKLNNIMFDETTNEPVCIVDLDTVMPGSALYDFGDAIRYGASTAAEDEKDLTKVHFDIKLFESFARGFLKSAGTTLNECEKDNLAFSAKLMTLECGMRFLADYLNGDTYFGAAYPEHNLVRCLTQFKLVSEMEQQMTQMEQIIKSLS